MNDRLLCLWRAVAVGVTVVAIQTCFLCDGFAQAIFVEDFESGLSQWVGRGGGAHHGVIVQDPCDVNNHVLTFSELYEAGDVFSVELHADSTEIYLLSFDYLGMPSLGGTPGNLGGFIGIADDTPGWRTPGHCMCNFLAATVLEWGATVELIDDGTWHHYAIEFRPYELSEIRYTDGTIRVMIEDWRGSGGVPGDALFDNIAVSQTGTVRLAPGTWGSVKGLYDDHK